nr:hypothetical protein [Tanacetum cinerariifolium]
MSRQSRKYIKGKDGKHFLTVGGASIDERTSNEIQSPGARNSSHGNNNDDDNTMLRKLSMSSQLHMTQPISNAKKHG